MIRLMMLSLLISNNVAIDKQQTIPYMIRQAEIEYGLPKGLLKALAHVESKSNHKAFVKEDGKSKHSSYGLTQIQLASAQQMGFKGKAKELMNPEINIKYGAAYLKWLLEKNDGNTSLALTCFNAGPNSRSCKDKKYGKYVALVFNAWISK